MYTHSLTHTAPMCRDADSDTCVRFVTLPLPLPLRLALPLEAAEFVRGPVHTFVLVKWRLPAKCDRANCLVFPKYPNDYIFMAFRVFQLCVVFTVGLWTGPVVGEFDYLLYFLPEIIFDNKCFIHYARKATWRSNVDSCLNIFLIQIHNRSIRYECDCTFLHVSCYVKFICMYVVYKLIVLDGLSFVKHV